MKEKSGLQHLDIAVTSACNLRCKHCYLADLKDTRIILPLEKIKEILKDARDLGAFHVILTGGEPTLHPNFPEILDFAAKLGFKITVFTNGTTLNRDMVKIFKERNVTEVQVSLDGPKDVHEKIRGKGTFEKTVAAIELLTSHDIKVIVNTQLTEDVIDNLQEYISFLKSIGVSKLLLTVPALLGEAKKNNIRFPDEKIQKLRLLYKFKSNFVSTKTYTCTALVHQLSVNFDGTVYPCHFFRSLHLYSLGNVYLESLRDIYLSWINAYSELLHFLKYGSPKCNACEFKEICTPCAARIFSLYKNFANSDLFYCIVLGKEKRVSGISISKLVVGRT